MNVILMGPPGAGKGTQAEFIKAKYAVPHISTGDMFRDAVKTGTPMGKEAQKYMSEGKLVPDQVTIGIVEDRLAQDDCLAGFLLDGFPRTIIQAEALDKVMDKLGKKIDAAINISVPENILIERMSGRVSCKECGKVYHLIFTPPAQSGKCDKCSGELIQRSDDNAETAANRLQVYIDQTSPLLDYYQKQGLLKNVDGNRDSKSVGTDIESILNGL
ncbi:adenylate kinase [hydrocarbon metagenome]|uniref:Adenylate kinase n=1 Tax=hydrocarbon metagenome TaxID=938273 RepID=A0A0W8E6V4_9ZZZZ